MNIFKFILTFNPIIELYNLSVKKVGPLFTRFLFGFWFVGTMTFILVYFLLLSGCAAPDQNFLEYQRKTSKADFSLNNPDLFIDKDGKILYIEF